jgi:hypothetical protein
VPELAQDNRAGKLKGVPQLTSQGYACSVHFGEKRASNIPDHWSKASREWIAIGNGVIRLLPVSDLRGGLPLMGQLERDRKMVGADPLRLVFRG